MLFNSEAKVKEKLQQTEQQWQAYQQQEANLSGFSTALLLLANGLVLSITLWAASQADLGNDEYRAAFIGLFTFAALAAFEILMPIGAAFLHIGQVIASADQVSDIIEQQPLVKFSGTEQVESNTKQPLLSVQNLDFHYPQRSNPALIGLNLTIQTGQKIAILGKTGSGKSTLLQLLVRNYDADQGQIVLAGKEIQRYSEQSLRQQFCFLTQRVHVFSDNLRNNLQIATHTPISDEKMMAILQQVGLEKLLQQEQGLDLWLGDGGRPLSGGEQRRLGLARILLNDAPILLLDEPTEGLDRETERKMLQAILAHSTNKTLIMVTHRLTAIEQFDQLVIIDNAKLIEQGTYQDLVNKENGFFKQLTQRI